MMDAPALLRVSWAEVGGLVLFLLATHYCVFVWGYTRGNSWAVELLERKKKARGE
jgi:hypothetical protein